MSRVVLDELVSLDLERLSAELIELGSTHEGFLDLPQRLSSGIGDLASHWAGQKENSGHSSPRLLSGLGSPPRTRGASPRDGNDLKRKRGSTRERSPLRTRNSAELRLGLEILSAVSSAAAAAAPPKRAAAAAPGQPERLVDVTPTPRALAKRTAARRAASAAAASSKPSLASSCTAFSLSANGPAPVSPFADAGMQACEGPAPGAPEPPRARIVKAEAAASPAGPATSGRVVERVTQDVGDGRVVLRTAGGAASEVEGPGADAEGSAAKRGDHRGEMPPGDAAALLARLGVADAQVSYACECNVQVCLKQHMWRNATARAELLRCNLFLYVEGPGAAGGGSGQVVWSAMHPRTVTTGVNAWATAGPAKARTPIEIEPPVTRRQAAARAAARAKAVVEEGLEEGSGDEGSQGAAVQGAGAPADAGPPDAGSDDAGEGLAPCARSRVGRSDAACRAGSCADECHEPHVFAVQEAVLVKKSCELHAVVDVRRSMLPPAGGCILSPPAWGPGCIVDAYVRVRPPRGADVWLKLPSSVRAPPALGPPA